MSFETVTIGDATLLQGDCLAVLRTLPAAAAHCCVTSPPYFALRSYLPIDHPDKDREIGSESSPSEYILKMVEVFREVRRVLRDDGTLWLNIGDSYASAWPAPSNRRNLIGQPMNGGKRGPLRQPRGMEDAKEKDLIGIPWALAFALRADGWYLRSDVIWAKPNPMPESVTDRPTKSHEYLFLLTKNERYFYDAQAIAEPAAGTGGGASFGKQDYDATGTGAQSRQYDRPEYATRNRRSVWTVCTEAFSGAHFATFPPKLIEPCVLAGCPLGGTVIDPFSGAATTGVVALKHGRKYIGIELNPEYIEISRPRLEVEATHLFAEPPARVVDTRLFDDREAS